MSSTLLLIFLTFSTLIKAQDSLGVEFSILEEPKENIISNEFAKLTKEQIRTDYDGYAMTVFTFGKSKGNYYILVEAQGESLIFKEIALQKNRLLFLIFTLFGGLGIFIFGLNYGSKAKRTRL